MALEIEKLLDTTGGRDCGGKLKLAARSFPHKDQFERYCLAVALPHYPRSFTGCKITIGISRRVRC